MQKMTPEFFKGIRDGETEMLELALERYAPIIWKIYRAHPVWLAADEWSQDCRIALYNTAQGLTTESFGAFTNYFCISIQRQMWKYWRENEQRRELTCNIASYGESIQRIGQDRPTITQLMNVNDIIATLTENEQKVIMMYAAGYSTNEIAGIFDTVPSTVRSRIMWIRRRVQAGNS
ncbi:RNA polymerase sigma factor [Weissella soli]|uniref:RNA polymerase sigma factor n=2 Tax=Weissella soli TaxID=155866 RepID=UPI001F418501|nr:sigma-70 family RNA polymerase sigma factor [Weissella soli]GJM47661.1 hypothetical protein WSSLDB02_02180 [Weissella soli]